VVYIGHSTLTPPKSPKDPEGPSRGLSPEQPKKRGLKSQNATPQNLIEQIRSLPRDHCLLRFENRGWKPTRRAAHYRHKLRSRQGDPHPEDGQLRWALSYFFSIGLGKGMGRNSRNNPHKRWPRPRLTRPWRHRRLSSREMEDRFELGPRGWLE